MDWLTFVSKLLDSIAWPAAAVFIVCLLRKSLTKLIPLLRRLKYKDWEAEFEAGLKEADEARAAPSSVTPEDTEISDRVAELLSVSPAAAVLASWQEVERAARDAASRRGIIVNLSSVRVVARELEQKRVINSDHARIFNKLRQLRNIAVNGGDAAINLRDAEKYSQLAFNLIHALRKAAP